MIVLKRENKGMGSRPNVQVIVFLLLKSLYFFDFTFYEIVCFFSKKIFHVKFLFLPN